MVSDWRKKLPQYDVIWTTPSKNQDGSMPIGNGEVGLNVWMDRRGRLYMLIARTDAWDEIGRLCKIGRLCLEFNPSISNIFTRISGFKQRLNLLDGCIEISATKKANKINIRIWVDANNPVVHIEIKTTHNIGLSVRNEVWRNTQREISLDEESFPIARQEPQIIYPDRILSQSDGLNSGQIGWIHANPDSIWEFNLKHQGLEGFIPQSRDPLRHRIFGCIVQGTDLTTRNSKELQSIGTHQEYHIQFAPITEDPSSPEDWIRHTQAVLAKVVQDSPDTLWRDHQKWWDSFWDRSWIFAGGCKDAEIVTQGYILQRWINACGGRGNYPIKFNGSIFTVDTNRNFTPDYRRWGPQYWFQNTRLPYWSMIMAGDFDLFQSFIQMYVKAIPLARFRNKLYYNHPGYYMPETMTFWGTYDNRCFGYDRGSLKISDPIENRYIRYHYNSTLEFLAMLLEYHRFTQDSTIWNQIILPVAEEVLLWWSNHWPRDDHGKLFMSPTNSVETYWDCINPTPDLAGLQWVLENLLQEKNQSIPDNLKEFWEKFRQEIPPIRIGNRDGTQVIFPAYEPLPPRTNCENPELYSVFPYPIYGLTKPDLELARITFRNRIQYNHVGWSQDEIQAALLGLTNEVSQMIVKRAKSKHRASRFPAFWGPNFDWIPDQDHGSNLMTALQRMVVQDSGGKIILLPAWPKSWAVEFKLHLPHNTTIIGEYNQKDVKILEITPPERMNDI
jgi:hypothetical protein